MVKYVSLSSFLSSSVFVQLLLICLLVQTVSARSGSPLQCFVLCTKTVYLLMKSLSFTWEIGNGWKSFHTYNEFAIEEHYSTMIDTCEMMMSLTFELQLLH